jgi:hypothetical protein
MKYLLVILSLSFFSFGINAFELKRCALSGGTTTLVKSVNGKQVATSTIEKTDAGWFWDFKVSDQEVLSFEYPDPNGIQDSKTRSTSYEVISKTSESIYALKRPGGFPHNKLLGQTLFIDIQSNLVVISSYGPAKQNTYNPFTVIMPMVYTCGN